MRGLDRGLMQQCLVGTFQDDLDLTDSVPSETIKLEFRRRRGRVVYKKRMAVEVWTTSPAARRALDRRRSDEWKATSTTTAGDKPGSRRSGISGSTQCQVEPFFDQIQDTIGQLDSRQTADTAHDIGEQTGRTAAGTQVGASSERTPRSHRPGAHARSASSRDSRICLGLSEGRRRLFRSGSRDASTD